MYCFNPWYRKENLIETNNYIFIKSLLDNDDELRKWKIPERHIRIICNKGYITLLKLFINYDMIEEDIDILNIATQYEYYTLIKFLLTKHKLIPSKQVLKNVIYDSNINMIKTVLIYYPNDIDDDVLKYAVIYSNIAVLKLLLSQKKIKFDNDKSLRRACLNGNYEAIIELSKYLKVNNEHLCLTVSKGSIELIDLLLNKYNLSLEYNEFRPIKRIARSNNAEKLEYYMKKIIPTEHLMIVLNRIATYASNIRSVIKKMK